MLYKDEPFYLSSIQYCIMKICVYNKLALLGAINQNFFFYFSAPFFWLHHHHHHPRHHSVPTPTTLSRPLVHSRLWYQQLHPLLDPLISPAHFFSLFLHQCTDPIHPLLPLCVSQPHFLLPSQLSVSPPPLPFNSCSLTRSLIGETVLL